MGQRERERGEVVGRSAGGTPMGAGRGWRRRHARAHDSSGPAAVAAGRNIITAAARVLGFLLYLVSRGKIRQVAEVFWRFFWLGTSKVLFTRQG